MEFEAEIIRYLQSFMTGDLLSTFFVITAFGSVLGVVLCALVIGIKNKRLCAVFLVTLAVTLLLNYIIKVLIGRLRPFDSYDNIINYAGESGYSMPSSHCVVIAEIAVFLCYHVFTQSKKLWARSAIVVFAVILSLLVGLSRMVLGVHYLTDVLVGLAFGAIVAIYTIHALRSIQPQKEKIAEAWFWIKKR